MPIWIISLDLSKAFDRVHWPLLWRALSLIIFYKNCKKSRYGKLLEPTKAADYLTLNEA